MSRYMPRTKADVEQRRDGPAVNVKVQEFYDRHPLPLELGQVKEQGDTEFRTVRTAPEFTHEWIEANLTPEEIQGWWDVTAGWAWEQLDGDATDIFGPGVKVYQDGRSGGWAVVDGLPDVEGWDAIALGKWRSFCRAARLIADDHPHQMLSNIYANVFEVALMERAEDAEAAKSEGVAAT